MGPSSEITDWCEAILESASARTVLDLGCGAGRIATVLATAGFAVSAVDRSARRISLARRRNDAATYFCSDFFSFLPQTRSDEIIVSRVLHQLPGDQRRRLLALCREWLTPNGTLLIIDAQRPSILVATEELVIGLFDRAHYQNYKEFIACGGVSGQASEADWQSVTERSMRNGILAVALRPRS